MTLAAFNASVPKDLFDKSELVEFFERKFRSIAIELSNMQEKQEEANNVFLTLPKDYTGLDGATKQSIQEFLAPLLQGGSTSLIPKNIIVAYDGSLEEARRLTQWQVCESDPDLRHKFLRGASGTDAGGEGGSDTLPSHSHNATATVASASHTHTVSAAAGHTHTFTPAGTIGCPCGTVAVPCTGAGTNVASSTHTHTFTGTEGTTESGGVHSHAITGGDHDHTATVIVQSSAAGVACLPDYYEVIWIKKR